MPETPSTYANISDRVCLCPYWSLTLQDIAFFTLGEADFLLLYLVKVVISRAQRIIKVLNISLWVQHLPRVCAFPRFASLEHQKQ